MAIMVQYRNNTFGYVENRALDDLIECQKIVAFRRESGWARIGVDHIRRSRIPQFFDGPDRRAPTEKRSCLTCADFVNSICQSFDCSSRISWQGKQVQMNALL
jgi:hypothetical protein